MEGGMLEEKDGRKGQTMMYFRVEGKSEGGRMDERRKKSQNIHEKQI